MNTLFEGSEIAGIYVPSCLQDLLGSEPSEEYVLFQFMAGEFPKDCKDRAVRLGYSPQCTVQEIFGILAKKSKIFERVKGNRVLVFGEGKICEGKFGNYQIPYGRIASDGKKEMGVVPSDSRYGEDTYVLVRNRLR